ncbi:MAG TPA: tol-pal system protein YbgF [Thermoanaerobaculia bacterium]|nr:tol-pal system protein YbgF [Thermoanaerobaculia bacterium]
MRTTAAAAVLVLALGCASSAPPPPAPAGADTRLLELQTSMTELLERLDVLSDRISRLERAGEELAAAASRPASPAPATPPPAVATRGATPPSALRSADLAEQYRSAMMLFGARRLAEARAAFQQVFDADPAGDLADNALFWIGESYYGAGDYPNAISYYRRVSTEYGDQNKAPDAVYKLALAYSRTGDLVLARQTFQEVISRYPYSTAAAAARAQIERIKY